jgi:hypothetical protein
MFWDRVGLGFALSTAICLGATGAQALTADDLKCKGCVGKKDLGKKAVKSKHIKNGQVKTKDLRDGAATTDKIGDSAVTTDKIGNAAVTTDKIGNGAITLEKIDPAVPLGGAESGAEFVGGEQAVVLTAADTVFRTVDISAPGLGVAIVNASGYFSGDGTARCSITTGTSLDFTHLIIADTLNANYMAFAGTRGFDVPVGTTTFNLVCDAATGTPFIGDSNLIAMFFPTNN